MKRTTIMAGVLCAGISLFWGKSIHAKASIPVIELEKGEEFSMPAHGAIEIADETILRLKEDGSLQALEEGETEVVLRWTVKVKNKEQTEETILEEPIPEEPVDAENWIHKEEQEVIEDLKETEKEMEKEQTETEPEALISIELPDTQAPEICFENLSAFQSGETGEHPVLSFKDSKMNQKNIRIFLEGERTGQKEPEVVIERKEEEIRMTLLSSFTDDTYTLVCTAWDDYGNLTEKKWIFTVNQNGTTFQFDKEKNRVSSLFDPEIVVENLDAVTVVSCMVNGESVSYEWEEGKIKIPGENLKKGNNRISLTVRDAAGNVSEMEPWDFYVEPEQGDHVSEEKGVEEKEEEMIQKQQGSPMGIIFLIIGSIAVFWEKKMCYNDRT